MKVKKVPLRMCVGCRERKNKRELIRVVRTPEAEVVFDPTGKRAGRGAYICAQDGCLTRAVKSHALEKALSVPISTEIYERLRGELTN